MGKIGEDKERERSIGEWKGKEERGEEKKKREEIDSL